MSNALTIAIQGHKDQLEKFKPELSKVLPPHITPDRIVRSVVNALSSNQYLATNCDKLSVLQAAMTAAVLGLEVDNAIGQGYIVPFKGKAQFICGYKGYITLAYNSGFIVDSEVVRAKDHFRWAKGLNPTLEHVPAAGSPSERGPITHVYATARNNKVPTVFRVLHVEQVNQHRDKSEGYKSFLSGKIKSTPWETDYEAMAAKTAIRALAPQLPLNVQRAAALESAFDRGHHAFADGNGVVIDQEQNPGTGATAEQPDLSLELGLDECKRCGGSGTVQFKDASGEGIEPCPVCGGKK